ncbi:hypothetical protein FOMPIDRAFT_1056883 [Fomitopsis schrenkii]|uniref:Uncharacterized protein n=1 Tax=Fomitopsis schrenkii TaxID=2126942 RepID=S8F053_FOMSC|nr:hypothetical protein FOMPIDRAFT_1056883 [Fomitopsis schrenkii]
MLREREREREQGVLIEADTDADEFYVWWAVEEGGLSVAVCAELLGGETVSKKWQESPLQLLLVAFAARFTHNGHLNASSPNFTTPSDTAVDGTEEGTEV